MKEDDTRSLLARLIRQRKLSMAKASRAIGRNQTYIAQYLAGRPKRLPAPVRTLLGQLLDVDPDRLAGEEPRRLDRRLARRASAAVESLGIGDPRVEVEAIAAVYALLERQAAGHQITDDAATLRIIRELVARTRRNT